MEVKPVLFNYNTYCGYGVEFENYSKYKYDSKSIFST